MRETKFIQQNQEKWKAFEEHLSGHIKDPDQLSEFFVQVTDDLSYSRTFYSNRSVRVYLNSLAQRAFLLIYNSRRKKRNRFFHFWAEELPQLAWESRRDFLFAFLTFTLAFLIGMLSAANDPEFIEAILGPGYVEMTLENIEKGDPMGVYKQSNRLDMAFGITINNLWVAFLTFIMGIIYCVGTLGILLQNGVMIGAFQQFFIEKGLFWESFLTVWTHGTLEISAIIIAGGAGITMGRGLAFPGTYSRMQSFQRLALRGLRLMFGIAPIIVLAGFIEGFLTRYTETPDWLRGSFIFVCLAFVLLYFLWYPRIKARIGFENKADAPLQPLPPSQVHYHFIKPNGIVFADLFILFRSVWIRLIRLTAGISALFCLVVFLFFKAEVVDLFYFPVGLFGSLGVLDQLFFNERIPWLPLFHGLLLSILTTSVFDLLRMHKTGATFRLKDWIIAFMKSLPVTALWICIIWTNNWYTTFIIAMVGLVPVLWQATFQVEGSSLFQSAQRCLEFIKKSYGRILGLGLTLFLTGILFFSIVDTTLLWFLLNMVSVVVYLPENMGVFSTMIQTFITLLLLYLVISMGIIGVFVQYFTLCEIADATHLQKEIADIRIQKKIRGILRE